MGNSADSASSAIEATKHTEVAALPSTDYLNTSSIRGKAQRSAPGHKSRPQTPPPEGGVGGDITGEKPIHVSASHDVKSQVWAVHRHTKTYMHVHAHNPHIRRYA